MDVDEGLSVADVDAFSVVEELDIVVEVEEDEENDSWDFKIIVSSMTKFNVFYCGMIVLLFFLLLDILLKIIIISTICHFNVMI